MQPEHTLFAAEVSLKAFVMLRGEMLTTPDRTKMVDGEM
jgi:hypothetical protein